MSQILAGHSEISNIIKEITLSPNRAAKYRQAYKEIKEQVPIKLSPSQVLAIFVEADLTRNPYEVINKQIEIFTLAIHF